MAAADNQACDGKGEEERVCGFGDLHGGVGERAGLCDEGGVDEEEVIGVDEAVEVDVNMAYNQGGIHGVPESPPGSEFRSQGEPGCGGIDRAMLQEVT